MPKPPKKTASCEIREHVDYVELRVIIAPKTPEAVDRQLRALGLELREGLKYHMIHEQLEGKRDDE